MLDDAAVFLRSARHEAGHIDEGDDRNIERITKAHKARCFDRALDIQATCQHQRLIGHNTHALAIHASKANHDVLCVIGL